MFNTNKKLIMNSTVVHELMRHLQDTNRVMSVSVQFAALDTDLQRVDYVYNLLSELNLLPPIAQFGKNDKLAENYREKGNEKYRKKCFEDALQFYNKSVALAELTGAQLALAFANRSAVLFELRMYEECLMDIERAFKHNYSNEPKKLLERKEKAAKLAPNQTKTPFNDCQLTIANNDRNPLIPVASKAIAIKTSPVFGKHIVATRDIKIGEVIAIEEPFAKVLTDNLTTHCANCFKLCYNLIPCDNCTQILYCSEECKDSAFKAYHEYECKILPTAYKIRLCDSELISLRIAIRAKDECSRINLNNYPLDGDEIYQSNRYKEMHNLVANTKARPRSDLFNRSLTAALIYHLMKIATNYFDTWNADTFKTIVLKQLQVSGCNFHEITELAFDEELGIYQPDTLGSGAFPFASLFNHSCYPNITRECVGVNLYIFAVRSIKKGEQCFDNYGCHQAVMPKAARQAKLLDQYYFKCSCECCANDWPLYRGLTELKPTRADCIDHKTMKLLQMADRKTAKEVLPKVKEYMESVEEFIPCKNYSDCQEIFKQCVAIECNLRIKLS